ncbi:MAG TPA: type II toxin-antitoxin system VapB family antitoxin [Cyclobacteriaceae bacterium]|nr:type II toxin-antitoxin system VapB family antitoxin [Cyclobacteriaceae bacterium]
MKITAIISDELIEEAMKYAGTKTITDALKVALKEYVALQKIKELSASVLQDPLDFKYSAKYLRDRNNL